MKRQAKCHSVSYKNTTCTVEQSHPFPPAGRVQEGVGGVRGPGEVRPRLPRRHRHLQRRHHRTG